MKALKAAENNATSKKGLLQGIMKVNAKETAHIVRFVTDPETAVFPIVSLPADPAIITAPGEMNLKGKTIDIKVRSAPKSVKRNSAHNP